MSDIAIPLSIPRLLGNEARYLAECVETNWVSSRGPFVDRFERMLEQAAGTAHAVACVNGTAALHVALLVAGVEPGDEVLLSDLTFIASANAVRYCGAWPVLIDAEPVYWQMDPQKLADFISRECRTDDGQLVNRSTGRRVRAIMPVHILGHPCDMDPIAGLARRHGLRVVADAAEALGTRYRGGPVTRHADVAALSFNGNKIITAGGGGAIVTDDGALAERARYLSTQAKDDEIEFVHGAVGFNYRMSNLQAAVGVAQLEQLDHRLASKRRTAEFYARALSALPVALPQEASWATSTWWLYTVLAGADGRGEDSRALIAGLAAQRIEARPLWRPISMQRPFADCQGYHCTVSRELSRRGISLPCSVDIPTEHLARVAGAVGEILEHAFGGDGSRRHWA